LKTGFAPPVTVQQSYQKIHQRRTSPLTDWAKAKKRLIPEYEDAGITYCESCGGSYILSFHHLDRRSSGKSQDTFEETRLLCAECHHKADNAAGYKDFNEELRKLR